MVTPSRGQAAYDALAEVIDPELDEPVTELGFVRSVAVAGADVEVHLRLPTSFCAPNFAYLMASDAKDVLEALPWTERVVVELDDHHDSDLINAGLAASAGYLGTFRHEAEQDLDELRTTFQRKAHTAAMERCVTRVLRDTGLGLDDLHLLRLGGVPPSREKTALERRRTTIGLTVEPTALVVVDDDGVPVPRGDVATRLRFARAVRISIEGNSHFCRGLLATRYADGDASVAATVISNERNAS